MMRKIIVFGFTILVLAAIVYAGGDPWKTKPYQQWDQKDVQKVLNDSPWSKSVTVVVSWRNTGGSDLGAPATTEVNRTGNNTMGSRGGGGGDAGSPPAEAPFIVRWVSSRAFREASVRSSVLSGNVKEEDAEKKLAQPADGYQIAIYGQDTTPFQSADETSLKSVASLTGKKTKSKLSPASVALERDAAGKRVTVVVFTFPKKTSTGEPTIADDEKNVEFDCVIGGAKIKASFDIPKMQDAQGRDL